MLGEMRVFRVVLWGLYMDMIATPKYAPGGAKEKHARATPDLTLRPNTSGPGNAGKGTHLFNPPIPGPERNLAGHVLAPSLVDSSYCNLCSIMPYAKKYS